MSSGDKRIGTSGDSMPFGTEVLSVGPILQAEALILPIYVPVGMGAIRVKKVRSITTVDTSGISTITVKKQHAAEAAVPMTGGSLVIASAGGVADEDSCDIVKDANARVPEGDKILLDHDGTPASGEALFFIEYERCQ